MAGRRIADLLIKIGADSYEFKQVTQKVEKDLEGLSKKLMSIGKTMSLAVTVPLMAIGAVAVSNADIQEKAEAKVQQAIKATGGAAQLTFQQIAGYASELQGKSIFGDEKILNDNAAVLLGFTKIAGDNFKRTQQAALDLATVLQSDLKSTTVQLGKALNDPVKNLSALSRMGIQFSKEQTAVIRSLAETNRLAEAQGIILDELAMKYGGQAEAAAKVGLGALQQLKNSWGDFLEQIGSLMMPVITKIAGALSQVVAKLQNMNPHLLKVITIVAAMAAAVGPLALALGSVIKILPTLKAGMMLLLSPIAMVKKAFLQLTVAISTNPIGLLLTALAAGITLFAAFGSSAEDAAESNGELTNKIIDEGKEVNLLIGKLSSANTSEKERKAALDELKRIQPDIVSGLNSESLELKTLTERAQAYNHQLVLRIALARKQDQVAAAIEKQTEAGVKQAEKEAQLYGYLTDIGSKITSGDFEFGKYNPNKGFTEWTRASGQMKNNMVSHFNDIMSSGDSLDEKARRVWLMFSGTQTGGSKIRMDGASMRQIQKLRGQVTELGNDVVDAAAMVADAEADVKNFADAFSLALNPPPPPGGDDPVERTRKSIAELNEEIRELEQQKQESFDDAEIRQLNARIGELKTQVDRLNSLGTTAANVKGQITLLNDQIKELERKKQSAFDVAEIAEYNRQIKELKDEVSRLNSVMPDDLKPIVPLEPILTGDLADLKPVMIPLRIEPKLMGLELLNKKAEEMAAIRDKVKESMFGWAGDISAGLAMEMQEVNAIVGTYVESLVQKGWSFTAALDEVSEKVASAMKQFDDQLSGFLANSVTAAAEAIGQMMVGDLGLDGLLTAILQSFANFLKQIGAQLIEFGIMMIAFKSALKSVLANPWAAIAVGAAMVAAAAIMTALIQKNAKKNVPKLAKGGLAYGPTYAMVGDNPGAHVDPEVIAPLSKLRGMMSQGGTQNIALALSGELTAKGRDLVYVLGKENFKFDVIG